MGTRLRDTSLSTFGFHDKFTQPRTHIFTLISVHEITFLWVMDVLWLVEPLETLHCDGEAERHEEDRVHQRAKHLGPRPTEGVLKR